MEKRVQQGLAGAFALAAIVGGGLAWQQRAGAPDAAVVRAVPAPLPAAQARAGTPARVQAASVLPAALPLTGEAVPVGVLVERLLATHDPQQAYAAYLMVSSCAGFNSRHDMQVHDDKLGVDRALNAAERAYLNTTCGNMTERERQARLDYLAIAVKAGVPGTAWTYAAEGPFGDPSALKTRPDDPLVREWKAGAVARLAQSADAGDPATLVVWGLQNLGGSDLAEKNPALAYRYLIAFGLIAADRSGPDSASARVYADGSPMMNAFQFDLTPEQRASEQAAARHIADNAKSTRKRQG